MSQTERESHTCVGTGSLRLGLAFEREIKRSVIEVITCVLILEIGTRRQTDHLGLGPAERASDWAWPGGGDSLRTGPVAERASDQARQWREPQNRPGGGESLRTGPAAERAPEQAQWQRELQNRPGGGESLRTGPVTERASEQALRWREPQKGPAAERASDWAQWQTEREQLVRSWHRDKE